MAIVKVEKAAWHPYFDRISKLIQSEGKQAEIEVDALNIGAQIEAEWLPLQGIVYDEKSNLVEVLCEGLDHLIYNPTEIYVDHTGTDLTSVEVTDKDGVKQIIRLREPVLLPAPGGA
ncbi:DUF5335 domain-containing protein [Massilia horti]|uniref:Uncharacterized protein n=1 Tax=Massilia horti TaxID=2562153 RepID=A0A4Y9SR72_9BURK|nr:DUF5335 domain-containing protein [Massilia horti]TFW27143.1 hypothetical protein E4O92_24620 [Massilia horti]